MGQNSLSYVGPSIRINQPGSMKKKQKTVLYTFKYILKKQYLGNLAGSQDFQNYNMYSLVRYSLFIMFLLFSQPFVLTFILSYLPSPLPSLINLFYFIHYISTSLSYYVCNMLFHINNHVIISILVLMYLLHIDLSCC